MNETIRDFGRIARPIWTLPEGDTFLNHGSFGACPIDVQEAQAHIRSEYSRQPEEFFRLRVMPDNEMADVRAAGHAVAAFVGAAGENIALVENATTGIQAVLESVALKAGDQILITDHQYRAVRLAVEQRCRETGASPLTVPIPVPTSAADVLERIAAAANPRIKLAIIDHITSSTAIVFPIRQIVAELGKHGIPVLVDGAHAIGQVPLSLDALGADWYVSNLHKWAYAPPGSAFLHARGDRVGETRCLITSLFADLGFPRAFDYVGTRDYGNWLTIPAALAFHRRIDPDAITAHNAKVLKAASAQLLALGALPVCEMENCAAMRSFWLPQRRKDAHDAVNLRNDLWRDERIQVGSSILNDQLMVRISAQAYVDVEDVIRLGAALSRRGWPGR